MRCVVKGPGELGEREGLALEVGTMTEKDGGIHIDGAVHLAREGIVGDDTAIHLDHVVVEPALVGEDKGV